MGDIVNMDYGELCELADALADMLVLAKRYDFDAVDTDELLKMSAQVDARLNALEAADEIAMNREYERDAL